VLGIGVSGGRVFATSDLKSSTDIANGK
jgi:hypothetical protein